MGIRKVSAVQIFGGIENPRSEWEDITYLSSGMFREAMADGDNLPRDLILPLLLQT